MGHQQSKNNQNNLLKPPQQKNQEVLSDIFESSSPTNLADRTIQAIKISDYQRTSQEIQQPQSFIQKKSEMDQLCRLSKNTTQSSNLEQQRIVLQGVLSKCQPSKIFSQISQRFCTLSTKKFKYNQDDTKYSKRAGVLNFELLSCDIITQSKNQFIQNFRIKVNGSDKQFVFSALTGAENRKWVDALNQITKKSAGKQHSLTYLSHYHRFWRKDYFSQEQFRIKAETGDLILMRGASQSAVMQRAITQQQYDHVALVLRNVKNQILLFEANGTVGVGIMPWHRFIQKQYFKQQQIVVYRKLKIERTKQFYEQFQNFVQRNLGRKYKFSVQKFIMKRESINNQQNQDNKTYFCSSLVAKLYKNLQILDEKVSSIQYWPHDFTQKQDLQLRQDGKFGPAKLGKQHIIVFQKVFFQKN